VKFAWDPRKAASNVRKHGVGFDEAMTVFADWGSFTIPDPGHSGAEERFVIIGFSSRRRVLVVSHSERDENIRIISARRANARERRTYGQQD
jgi:uncharacterized DUF497 family protein